MAGGEFTSKFSGASNPTNPDSTYIGVVKKYNNRTREVFVHVHYLNSTMRISDIAGVALGNNAFLPGDKVVVGFMNGHISNPIIIGRYNAKADRALFYDLTGDDDAVISKDMLGHTIRFYQSLTRDRSLTMPANYSSFIHEGSVLRLVALNQPTAPPYSMALDFDGNGYVLQSSGATSPVIYLTATIEVTLTHHGDGVWLAAYSG